MRPGAVLFEIDPYGCCDLSFIFRRWAEVFNLQYALRIPSTGNNNRQDEVCLRESQIEVNVKEIIDELKNSIIFHEATKIFYHDLSFLFPNTV
ncbi:unnamed protein product [Adineta ricciae]|uniref:Uncharacterized protein n=1 Tax=Adineta ricciae TaxID=249248 RepID=A0A813NTY7_ADIRI|nr:unnamed protein product [Adineta ricciae]CAF0744529.1 unnamed protein product [Adineta ricciae]